jgi:hypothetical protein
MKLARIPSVETTVKHSFSFRQSTSEKLEAYQKRYQKVHGQEVTMKDLVEHMLMTFMEEDKAFQKELRDQDSRPPASERESKPAATERHSSPQEAGAETPAGP